MERLCYIGTRGMGGLEFIPSINQNYEKAAEDLQLYELVKLANQVLSTQSHLKANLVDGDDTQNEINLQSIISVGTSAGGARAKAVIAWNKETRQVKSGQVKCPPGFEYYLLKFDGISNNRDKELCDPQGFGRTEFAYYEMALAAGINMSESRLLEENGRAHFMTKRFDRLETGKKLHMQSLCAIAHYDFNMAGAYSYEQAMQIMKQLDLLNLQPALEQQYRRMVFNIISRNQDDHTKNIAFLMDQTGQWHLSPAFDITYSYNPEGEWTSQHQMSVNGKREYFLIEDLLQTAKVANLSVRKAKIVINEVIEAIEQWPTFASAAGVNDDWITDIGSNHRKI